MRARFIVRLLDDSDNLLAWAEVFASARTQNNGACPLIADQATLFAIERDGYASKISVHWADLNVARVQTLIGATPVSVGQVVRFDWIEPVWLVAGMQNVPLPQVTVRQPVKISVPVGALAAVV